jgi:hypothetical protein
MFLLCIIFYRMFLYKSLITCQVATRVCMFVLCVWFIV